MTSYIIELRNVSKSYAGENVPALHTTDLAIRPGEFFTLLGPSGCGKSTTLRLIAGFETPTSGEILIQGQSMKDVPPYRRPVNMVFQDYALFPHMTVAQNVAFGLTVKKVPRREREQRVRDALAMAQLTGLENRHPAHLSGGQKQRVALARALINQPGVLLLDEPLGALDFKLRKAMQMELKHLQQQVGITFIYVTHDQEEALSMSDRIAVMDKGHILQIDNPVGIYEKPASRFVADFVGETNFLNGTIQQIQSDLVQVDIGHQMIHVEHRSNGIRPGQTITVAVRPEKLRLDDQAPSALHATIQDVVYIGTDTRYMVRLESGELVAVRVQNIGNGTARKYTVGERVQVSWIPGDARILTA